MKKIIQWVLKILATKKIKKYKPFIIGITGSLGKSSTKEAIYTILKNHFEVRRSLKNYNNEIGLPLTILDEISPGKSLIGWFKLFFRAILKAKLLPKILILEMAADHLNDIKYLTKIAPCKIGIITRIAPVHLEFFKSLENIQKEKKIIITHLMPSDWAVLNADDKNVLNLKEEARARTLTYGLSEEADLRAMEINLNQEIANGLLKINGLNLKIKYIGSIVPLFLPKILAKSQVYAVLPAIACGIILGLNLVEIAEELQNYSGLEGRMRPTLGLNQTLIIDDSYNSSPDAVKEAFETFKELKIVEGAKKWAVLGDMLELGEKSLKFHRQVGQWVAKEGFDLVTVGKLAKDIAQSAKEQGLEEEKINSFLNSEEAGDFLKKQIQKGDLILVKGSQGVRMEKVVKKIMAEPEKAKDLLVRQGSEWL